MGDEIEHQSIALGIIGPGLVGKTLLGQLAEQVRLAKNLTLHELHQWTTRSPG